MYQFDLQGESSRPAASLQMATEKINNDNFPVQLDTPEEGSFTHHNLI